MLNKILADFVALIHLGFILFVIFGVFLVFKYNKLVWIHLPVIIWATLISLYRWVCPLTPLENYLRSSAGEQAYQVGFIEHYILPIIYPGEMTQAIAIAMGVFVIVWNSVFYLIYFINKRRASKP